MMGTQMDETSWIVFVGVANEHHGNTYQSNEQRGQHACSVHLHTDSSESVHVCNKKKLELLEHIPCLCAMEIIL